MKFFIAKGESFRALKRHSDTHRSQTKTRLLTAQDYDDDALSMERNNRERGK